MKKITIISLFISIISLIFSLTLVFLYIGNAYNLQNNYSNIKGNEEVDSGKGDNNQKSEDTKTYSSENWSITYPSSYDNVWDQQGEQDGMIQEPLTMGKTISFKKSRTTKEELDKWVQSEIRRKTFADNPDETANADFDNSIYEDLTVTDMDNGIQKYSYSILSTNGDMTTILMSVIFFDGQFKYEFYSSTEVADVTEEFDNIIDSFTIID